MSKAPRRSHGRLLLPVSPALSSFPASAPIPTPVLRTSARADGANARSSKYFRVRPAYVEDVAEAIARILAEPGTAGRTYELAGPTVYTLRELFVIALRIIGKRRLLVPLPFAAVKIQARLFELLPNPPLTRGQVDLLKADNVASGILPGLRELNILPKAIEAIVPTYLGRSRVGA